MCSRLAIVLLAVSAFVGCASSRAPQASDLYALGESLARSICPGPPTQVAHVANTHEPEYIDRIETRVCQQGASSFYVGELASDPGGLAMSVEVKASSAGLPGYLEIGAPINGARRVLGAPESSTVDTATYLVSVESEDTLSIRHTDGKIVAVRWSWVVD